MSDRLPWGPRIIEADGLQVNVDGPVMLEDRQGIVVHSFKCRICRLELQLYSWVRDRHTAINVACPQCGHVGGRKLHWMTPVNESRAFGSGTKIHDLNPHPYSGGLLADSDISGPWGPGPDGDHEYPGPRVEEHGQLGCNGIEEGAVASCGKTHDGRHRDT